MLSVAVFVVAAFFEIAGCFAFWTWLRRGASPFLAVIGTASLIGFAAALTRVDSTFAGRAYAAYGGIYIAAFRKRIQWRSPPILFAGASVLLIIVTELLADVVGGIPKPIVIALLCAVGASTTLFIATMFWELRRVLPRRQSE